MGQTEATRIMQFAVGVKNDGVWGEYTDAAVRQAMNKPAEVITNFTSRRQHVYEMMPGYQYFGTGWTRRNNEITQQALGMAA